MQLNFCYSTQKHVARINNSEAHDLILNVHYAGRLPSISYAYGLFDGGDLTGIVTYGRPASAPQRSGVCGEKYSEHVYELNRLCLKYNKKNDASYLVASSLKMLAKPKIIVSYADPDQGHIGYVYQATNFIYCGLTEKRTEWKVRGLEHLHSHTLADKFKSHRKPSEAIREAYGDDFYLKERTRKHRYIYFLGSKTEKKIFFNALRYETKPYPKTN